jgi:tetratricopeptide (TPR) repeat protein
MPDETPPDLLNPTFAPVFRELKTATDLLLKRWQKENARFAKAIDAGLPAAKALGDLGVQLCLQNRFAESIDVLVTALELAPDSIQILNDLAVVYERAGSTDLAINHAQHSLSLSENQTDSWIFLGNLKHKQGDLAAAAQAFQTALALDSTSFVGWQCLGIVRQAQREFIAAIECFRACIRLNHAPAPVLCILGQLFYSTGQFEKSRDAYTAAVGNDPHNLVYLKLMWRCSSSPR